MLNLILEFDIQTNINNLDIDYELHGLSIPDYFNPILEIIINKKLNTYSYQIGKNAVFTEVDLSKLKDMNPIYIISNESLT